jgi:uncharacterized membrane-anchored protein
MLFQTALILAMPAQAIYTQLTGKTVILQTVPADPYERLRGYSQTLRYDISIQDNLRKLPGWKELPKLPSIGKKELSFIKPGTHVYVILEAPKAPTPSTATELPQAWKPVAVSSKLPSRLPANRVALKGLVQDGFIQYGLETHYIPEDQREQINADLRAARNPQPTQSRQFLPSADPIERQPKPPIVMQIKVNDRGDTVPISVWARVGQGSKQQVRHHRF